MIYSVITEDDIERLSMVEQEILKKFSRKARQFKLLYDKQLKEELKPYEASVYLKCQIKQSIDNFDKSNSGFKIVNRILGGKSVYEICSFLFPKYYEVIVEKYEIIFDLFENRYREARLQGISHPLILQQEYNNIYTSENIENTELLITLSRLKFYNLASNIEKYSVMLEGRAINTSIVPFGLDLASLKEFEHLSFDTYFQMIIIGVLDDSEEALTRFLTVHALDFFKATQIEQLKNRILTYGKSEFEEPNDFTVSRQVLAIRELLIRAGVTNIDNSQKARFIQFLTRRNLGAKKINNTEVYKKLTDDNFQYSDYEYINSHFGILGLTPAEFMTKKR
jgi:hypothetical protein